MKIYLLFRFYLIQIDYIKSNKQLGKGLHFKYLDKIIYKVKLKLNDEIQGKQTVDIVSWWYNQQIDWDHFFDQAAATFLQNGQFPLFEHQCILDWYPS